MTWPKHITIQPHNHLLWSIIGVYSGREDNVFWRRLPRDGPSRVRASAANALGVGDLLPQGKDIIHSIVNPIPRMSSAIHIYGGDYFDTPRSEWDSESLIERPFNVEGALRRLASS